MPVEEKKKFDEDFEKKWRDYEKQREKFKEEHPDKAKKDDDLEDLTKYVRFTDFGSLRSPVL